MTGMIYLAQPIDQARRTPRLTRLVGAANTMASEARLSLFRPATAYKVNSKLDMERSRQIDAINQAAMGTCSGLLALLPLGVATLGTPTEIEQTLTASKPVAILVDDDLARGLSVQVEAWRNRGALVVPLSHAEDNPIGTALALGKLFDTPPAVEPQQPVMPYVTTDIAAFAPTKAYAGDAGLDLASVETVKIPSMGRALVKTGLAFALPEGTWGLIIGRSSTWFKRELMVMPGVIDVGWRGELFVSVYNPGASPVEIEFGDRLAQYIVLPAWQGVARQVPELPHGERGTSGFGSSGR